MAYLTSLAGIVVALGIMLVSATMNARYQMSLGGSDTDRLLWAAVALFGDIGKSLAWIFFAVAVAKRQVLAGLASLAIFVVCFVFAVSGCLGFISSQRTAATGVNVTRADTLKDLRTEKGRKELQLEKIGVTDSVGVMTKRIEAVKQDARFARTKECMDATNADSRSFCGTLKGHEGDLARAQAATKLETEIGALRTRIEGFSDVARNTTGDVQSVLIAQITGWKLGDIQLWAQVLVVAVVEFGACFMLFVSMNHWPARERARNSDNVTTDDRAQPVVVAHDTPRQVATNPPPLVITDLAAASGAVDEARVVVLAERKTIEVRFGNVVDFMKACVDFTPEDASIVEQAEVFSCYRAWCRSRKESAHDDVTLGKMFDMICEKTNITRKRHGETIYWLGVVLNPPRAKRTRRA